MKFHEKLDLIMNITNTTNSSLAKYLSLDPSHISRLRRGERNLSENASYIKKMAAFFAKHCNDSYQKKILSELLDKPGEYLKNKDELTNYIYHWLISKSSIKNTNMEKFMDGMSTSNSICFSKSSQLLDNIPKIKTRSNFSLYYGIQGKREGVLRFLSSILESTEIVDILLFSDENMEWLTGDILFQQKWMAMMCSVLEKGNRIKIIHTVSRDLDEMLESIYRWIPLYMTGLIEPYYYPKKRDGIFHRTIFASKDIAALSSNSIGDMAHNTMNVLYKEKEAISSLVDEFNNYLHLCKPLMQVYSDNSRLDFFKTLDEFEKEQEHSIVKSNTLSLVTMPEDVVLSILNRLKIINKDELLSYYKYRKEIFLYNIKKVRFHEILHTEDITNFSKKKLEVAYTGIKDIDGTYYTKSEYISHLNNIVYLLSTYDNYYLTLSNNSKDNNIRIYAKEELGVIIETTKGNKVAFAINEPNLTAAFWDYLSLDLKNVESEKSRTLNILKDIISKH